MMCNLAVDDYVFSHFLNLQLGFYVFPQFALVSSLFTVVEPRVSEAPGCHPRGVKPCLKLWCEWFSFVLHREVGTGIGMSRCEFEALRR
jgi:hypothetical protein